MTLPQLPLQATLLWMAAAYAVMSVATAIAYAADKAAARRGRRRVSERTLHTLALFGGWPGALLAQQLLRHKRRKRLFVLITWLIAAGHVGVVLLLLVR